MKQGPKRISFAYNQPLAVSYHLVPTTKVLKFQYRPIPAFNQPPITVYQPTLIRTYYQPEHTVEQAKSEQSLKSKGARKISVTSKDQQQNSKKVQQKAFVPPFFQEQHSLQSLEENLKIQRKTNSHHSSHPNQSQNMEESFSQLSQKPVHIKVQPLLEEVSCSLLNCAEPISRASFKEELADGGRSVSRGQKTVSQLDQSIQFNQSHCKITKVEQSIRSSHLRGSKILDDSQLSKTITQIQNCLDESDVPPFISQHWKKIASTNVSQHAVLPVNIAPFKLNT